MVAELLDRTSLPTTPGSATASYGINTSVPVSTILLCFHLGVMSSRSGSGANISEASNSASL